MLTKRIACLAASAATFLILAAIVARGQETTQPASAPAGLPVSLSGFTDDATFYLYVNEERIVTIETRWKSDGNLETTSTIAMAGQRQSATASKQSDGE